MQRKTPLKISERSVKLYLFFFLLSVLIFISGGRLVSSDEVSMYLTVESIVTDGSLAIPFPGAPNSTTNGDRSYTWYEAGNILAGIPAYAAGYGLTSILRLPQSTASLVMKAIVSLTSALIGAWLAVMLYSLSRYYGVKRRQSAYISAALVLTTFLLPYFKMFMREPILALCLLGGTGYLIRALNEDKPSLIVGSGIFIGYGILTKLAFALNLLPLGLYLLLKSYGGEKRARTKMIIYFAAAAALIGFGGTIAYNYLRTGNPLDTGYAGGRSFNIPFYTGMFGLLLSPGKGIFWFAPLLFLIFPALRWFYREFRPETWLIVSMFLLNLIVSSVYIAWGGDGSWGPRYLAPFLPLFFLMIAFYIGRSGPVAKNAAILLSALGLIVQIGGASIYAGAYLREIGEYPYQKNFDDPEFLSKAHFIPDYSPVIGHWRMLSRNVSEHLNGEYPKIAVAGGEAGDRLPVAEAEREKLLHTIDFWFTYALCAGLPKGMIASAVLAGLALITLLGTGLRRSLKATG